MTQTQFNVGDKVFDIRFGWGEVIKITKTEAFYPLLVKFFNRTNLIVSYTGDGMDSTTNINPILSRHEYTINGMEPRMVEVSKNNKTWVKRTIIGFDNDLAVCRYGRGLYHGWEYCREVKQEETERVVELTLQDISEGKGVGVKPHLIRIV
jgi:hypothetical protein